MGRPRKPPPELPGWYPALSELPVSPNFCETARRFVARSDPARLSDFDALARKTQESDKARQGLLLLLRELVARHRSPATLARWDDALLDAAIYHLSAEEPPSAKDPAPKYSLPAKALGAIRRDVVSGPQDRLLTILEAPRGTRRARAASGREMPSDLDGYWLVVLYDRLRHVLARAYHLRRQRPVSVEADPVSLTCELRREHMATGTRALWPASALMEPEIPGPAVPLRTDSPDFYRLVLHAARPGLGTLVPPTVLWALCGRGVNPPSRRRKQDPRPLWARPADAAYVALETLTGRRREYLQDRIASLRQYYRTLSRER